MKNSVIRINTSDDIDTSKISVYDLNNRYVDATGTWFGLRYNRETKRVEVIKLLRASAGEIQQMKQQIGRTRESAPEAESVRSRDLPIVSHIEEPEYEYADSDETGFDPDRFISESVTGLINHKSRLAVIIRGIKNAGIIPKENKADSIELDDIFRSIEIDAIQGIDKLETYQKELVNYPRSPSYYVGKLDRKGKEIYDLLSGSDNHKIMRFIYRFELYYALSALYKTIRSLIKKLSDFIADKNPEESPTIPHGERQMLKDSIISIDNTLDEIDKLTDNLVKLKEYVYNIDRI